MLDAHADEFAPFTQEASARGVAYPVQGVPQTSGMYGFGVCLADLDADGDDDLVAIGRSNGVVGLFRNNGAGVFSNVSTGSGISPLVAASAILAVDIDGDRLPEILLTQVGAPSMAYRNLGGMQFAAHPWSAQFGQPASTKAISAADIDGDGDLDFYLANYPSGSQPTAAERNRLLRNDGTSLTDLAPSLGLDRAARSFLGVFSDFNADGYADLYVSNDRGHLPPLHAANQLWIGDGLGGFVDAGAGSGADVACFSMGAACGDLDGNGTTDLLVTNLPSADAPVFGVQPLMLGDGRGGFVRAEQTWGVDAAGAGWGALFVDLDNSGTLDLFVNQQGLPNALWLNPGTPPAISIPSAGGAVGVPNRWNYCTAAGDLDRDGDLDLVCLGLGSNLLVYMNHAGDGVHSVRLRLEGTGMNREAVGARVWCVVGGRTLLREVQAGGVGYLGQNSLELHFGLGVAAHADRAVVRFPDGTMRAIDHLIEPGAYGVCHPQLLGDGNDDGEVDSADGAALEICLSARTGAEQASPCVRFDFDGDLRVTHADAMRFEQLRRHVRADLDSDRFVGARDVAFLLSEWGRNGSTDLDDDGTTDAIDLAVLFASWGPRP